MMMMMMTDATAAADEMMMTMLTKRSVLFIIFHVVFCYFSASSLFSEVTYSMEFAFYFQFRQPTTT